MNRELPIDESDMKYVQSTPTPGPACLVLAISLFAGLVALVAWSPWNG